MKRDIVITWPKTKPLDSYLDELAAAVQRDALINYRVGRLPRWQEARETIDGLQYWDVDSDDRPRSFMVHEGQVRGWCWIVGAGWREDGEVEGWPAGWYVVRDPFFIPIPPQPMRGFQGWRWVTEEQRRLWLPLDI
jgi:hypothetical protein